MPNSNCLEGMACPVCGSEGPFEIAYDAVHLVYDYGIHGILSELEFDNASYCGCRGCSHSGVVGNFQINKSEYDNLHAEHKAASDLPTS